MSKQKKDKIKQVSYSQVEKIIKTQKKEDSVIEINVLDEIIPVTVKHTISISEVIQFIHSVANSCFVSIEDETGKIKTHFAPYYKSVIFKKNIMDYFTSFKNDDNLERAYNLVSRTEVLDEILRHIDPIQLEEIKTAIDELIEFKKQELLANKPSRLDNLIDNINDIVLKIGEKIDGFDMEEISKHIPAISEALSSGTFDAEKIAKAFVDLKADEGADKGIENEDNAVESRVVSLDFSKDTE